MQDNFKKATDLIEQISELEPEAQFIVWTGLSNLLTIQNPNQFFYVIKNSILNPFTSEHLKKDFGSIMAAVFFTLQHKLFSDPRYKSYYNTLADDEEN